MEQEERRYPVEIHTFSRMVRQPAITDAALREAAAGGEEHFVAAIVDALRQTVGGELTQEALQQLNADQLTLLVWDTVRREVSEGGFVQLIHNGYGPLVFRNPFARAVKQLWGLRDLSRLVYDAHTLYLKHHEQIERDCTDEEFMALYEQLPAFDELDDAFVEHDDEWTATMAHYIDEHLERFVTIMES